MEHLASLVASHPYLALYAFIWAEFISALMIAQKSRGLLFLALTVAILFSTLVPAGEIYY
jgi:hypothetical protein